LTQNQLTLTGSVNGVATTQSVNITDNSANNTETINFGSFGVAFDVKSYQNQTANQIGQSLAALNSTSNGTPGQIIVGQGANSNLQFQSGANSSAFIGINTLNVQTGVTGTNAGSNSAMMTVGTDITGVNATGSAQGSLGTMTANNSISDWQTAFQNAAAAIDKAVDYISTQRATYGSQMNRLSYISSNLTAQSTNLQTSKSSITDTNFASETATLTKGQIMQQAATAMLAQANQMPNVILSLLK
jgi:flagellin